MCFAVFLWAFGSPQAFADKAGELHREKAEFFFFHGDTLRAICEFEETLKTDPNNWQVHLFLANLLLKREEDLEARKHLEEVIRLHPNDRDSRILLAQVFTKSGDHTSAMRQLEFALSQRGDSGFIHQLMGFSKLREGKASLAEVEFRLAERGDKNNIAKLGLAIALFHQGKLEEALFELDQYLKFNEKNSDAQKIRGDLLSLLGRKDDARAVYKTAMELAPDNVEAYLALGNMYYREKEYPAAVEEFRKGAKLKSANSSIFYALGLALEKSGRLQEAGEEYINGAFIEKDKAIAHKMNLHGQKLRGNADFGKLDLESEDKTHNRPGALSPRDYIDVFQFNYADLVGKSGPVTPIPGSHKEIAKPSKASPANPNALTK